MSLRDNWVCTRLCGGEVGRGFALQRLEVASSVTAGSEARMHYKPGLITTVPVFANDYRSRCKLERRWLPCKVAVWGERACEVRGCSTSSEEL